MSDKRDILIRLLGEETVSRMAGKAGDGLDKFGDKLDATEHDARDLDRQIDEVEGSLKTLAVAFARTGDAADRMDITKAMRKQQTELRKLTKAKDLLDFDDKEAVRFGGRLAAGIASGLSRAGGPISAALSNVFGVLPPQAQVAIGAGLVGAAVAAAPGIGAVLSGAVVGAAGAGGIVGGIAIAARHPAVQASAKQTGDLFARTMERAGVSFVPATLDGLSVVRAGIGDMEDDLERAFSASSRFVKPLAGDFMSGAKRAVEGFATAAERSGPVMNTLGTIAERFGDVVGDTFEQLSEHSAEGADALMTLWGVFEFGLRSVAGTIVMLTTAYGWLEKFGAVLTGDTAALARMIAEQEAAKGSGNGLSGGLQELINKFKGTGNGAANAKFEIQSLAEAIKESTDRALSAENANIRLEQAIDDAAAAAKEGADKGINPNTEAGRKNRLALLGVAEAAKAASADILKNGGSHEMATVATERGRKKFLEAAHAMGVEKGEAIALANKLFGIPNINRSISVNDKQALAAISRVQQSLGRVRDIHRGIYYTVKGDLKLPGGTSLKNAASGGPVTGSGPKGIDSVPMVLAPGEHVLTAREVDAAGGHAGVERLRAMLRGGGRGAPVMAGAGGSAGGGGGAGVVNYSPTYNINLPATANAAEQGRQVIEVIKAYERGNGRGWRT